MSETTGNNDTITDGTGNKVSHIPNVSGSLPFAVIKFIDNFCLKIYGKMLPSPQIIEVEWSKWKELKSRKDPFEPTDEQIEQASMEYAEELFEGLRTKEYRQLKGVDFSIVFKGVLAKLNKIIGENVR